MECCHCSRTFANRFTLANHQRTAKYCLKIQGKSTGASFSCSSCKKAFTTKQNLAKHEKRCLDFMVGKYKEKTRGLKQEILKLKKENDRLKKELYTEKGKYEGATKSSKTVNNYINPKLLSITTDSIRPFTLETVREEITNGGYTREMFNRGTLGIVEFVANMISIENEDGVLERSYVCTDVSRNKFHRLLESNEWRSDNGAHFLTGVLDQLVPDVEEHYQDIVEKRRKAQAEEDEVEYEYYNNRVDEARPIYQGVKFKKGEAREKLFVSLRNKISRIAAV